MPRTRCTFFLAAALTFCAGPALAELPPAAAENFSDLDAWKLDDVKWDEKIGDLRTKSEALLETYRKLKSDYEFLTGALEDIQNELSGLRREVEIKQEANERLREKLLEQTRNEPAAARDRKKLETEIAALQEANLKLQDELKALQEHSAAVENQVTAATQQRDAIQLQLEKQEFSDAEIEEGVAGQVGPLRAEVEDARARAEALRGQLSALPEAGQDPATGLRKLAAEVEAKEQRLGVVKAGLASAKRDNARLEDELRAAGSDEQRTLAQMDREKKKLEQAVARLQSQLDAIKQGVETSSAAVRRKQALLDRIMRLDTENQRMRAQIHEISRAAEEEAPAQDMTSSQRKDPL